MKNGSLNTGKLSLAELRSTTGCFETVLFAFLHSGVTGQEACRLECGTVALVCDDQRTGNAVTDGACLTGNTAACDGRFDVDLTDGAGEVQGLTNDTSLFLY